jgi:hypothetical protein
MVRICTFSKANDEDLHPGYSGDRVVEAILVFNETHFFFRFLKNDCRLRAKLNQLLIDRRRCFLRG